MRQDEFITWYSQGNGLKFESIILISLMLAFFANSMKLRNSDPIKLVHSWLKPVVEKSERVK
jgi:hypothetical protein